MTANCAPAACAALGEGQCRGDGSAAQNSGGVEKTATIQGGLHELGVAALWQINMSTL